MTGKKRLQGSSMKVGGMASSDSWVVNMEKLLEETNLTMEMKHWKKTSIYRVPEWIKDMTNKKAYQPWLVSLGPFHHGKPDLLPMEEHKRRAVLHLVKRSKRPLGEFVSAIEEVADNLREAYQDLDAKWHRDNGRFIEMMVTDGCFMLEVMSAGIRMITGETIDDYAHNDPVFSIHGLQNLYGVIRSDIVVMENQLPLLVLERIVAVQFGAPPTAQDINTKVCKFLNIFKFPKTEDLGLHPLDILHICTCDGSPQYELTKEEDIVIPSVMELREAGVHFQKSKTKLVHDIGFENGVLSLPEQIVEERTKKDLLNLRVFEQLHSSAGSHVTNYLFMMDHLIDSERDVELLKSNGILSSCYGNDKFLAHLFNNLTKGATMKQTTKLNTMLREVKDHCRKRRNRWQTFFVRTYMSNPWVFISLLAATILLIATLMQTVYTVVPFYTKS